MGKVNEFGAPLDRNGYAPSIVQFMDDRCFLCDGQCAKLDRHEIFGGSGRRDKSKRLGLWVLLCHTPCHMYGPESAHESAKTAAFLHAAGQKAAMQQYGWSVEEFRAEFEKNYL